MIGTRIVSQPSFPTISVALGVIWVAALVVASAAGFFPQAMAAAPIGAFALVRWLGREKPLHLELTSEGLVLNDDPEVLPYDRMRSILIPSRPNAYGQFPIEVNFDLQAITIPAAIEQSSDELLKFLKSRIPVRKIGWVNPSLRSWLDEQLALFGEEKVYCFSPRDKLFPKPAGTVPKTLSRTMLLTAALWAVSTAYSPVWVAPAVIMVIFGGLFFLISLAKRDVVSAQAPNWKESTLLVTPAGIALIQGKLKGKLRWDEVLSLKVSEAPRFSITPVTPGVTVQVAGSQIVIMDLYSEPLSEIYQVMRDYHEGD